MNKQNNRRKADQMKKLTFTLAAGMLLTLLISSVAVAELAEVKVGKGNLKIGGILQAGFTYQMEDAAGVNAFTLNRARFLLWGDIVPDKVKYFLQLENKGGTGLLDYKARFFYIEKTEICVGRYLPMFTLYMPSSTAKLEMINYPLTTQKYAMWRQIGITSITKTEVVDFTAGIYNGADLPNGYTDNNDAKDFMGRVDIHPTIENIDLSIGGYAWIGSALPTITVTQFDTTFVVAPADPVDTVGIIINSTNTTNTFPEETLSKSRFGGFVKVDHKNIPLKVRAEFITAKDEFLQSNDLTDIGETKSMAYFGHLGYEVAPKVELLARYDFFDPNTDVDDNAENWFTFGVNYYLDGINSMFYLNYIMKGEEGDEVDNDMIVAQMQLVF